MKASVTSNTLKSTLDFPIAVITEGYDVYDLSGGSLKG